MSSYLIVFIVLSIFLLDAAVSLLKKLAFGNFGAGLKNAGSDIKSEIIVYALSCPAIAFFLTDLIWRETDVSKIIYPLIFLFVAYALYRPIMLYMDKAARKYPPANNDMSRKKEISGRRWASFIIGVLALMIAAILIFQIWN